MQREESPLDLFFKADRAEKERARSANAQIAASQAGPFQPPTSPRSSQTPPAPSSHSRSQYSHNRGSSNGGMFAFEMDGPHTPGTPYGPAFSTPYNERIKAARAGGSSAQIAQPSFQTAQEQEKSKAEMLKAYLFSPAPTSQAPPTTNHQLSNQGGPSHSRAQYNNNFMNDSRGPAPHSHRNGGRSSGLRQEVTPSKTPTKTPDRHTPYAGSPTPARVYRGTSPSTNNRSGTSTAHAAPFVSNTSGISSGDNSADLKGMEDSLRKILKLDSAGSSGSGIFSVPVASASVPNYVGGRPPPMNGMHNGVLGS